MVKKICLAASSGGHLEEISKIVGIKGKRELFLLTEKCSFNKPDFCDNIYYVSQINRKELTFIFKIIYIFFSSIRIMIKENPDCIISTGALATFPICLIGKIMRKKIIYIESFARIETPSLTGKLMYKIADLFIVQWEDMKQFFPEAVYVGGIF